MRKHRHLPFVAMFCLLLSGFCSVHAQQQAGKTRLLYLTLPPYNHVASSHRLVFSMHDDMLWFTFCSSAPIWLRVLSDPDLSQCVWCLPEHVAGWWPLRMLCGGRGCGMCTQGGLEQVFSWAELFCPPCMCRRAFLQ